MFYILLMCILNIVCLFVGIWVGQKVNRGEEIKLQNPIKMINEYKDSKEREKEQKEISIMLENIDNYNGTGLGQKDIEED